MTIKKVNDLKQTTVHYAPYSQDLAPTEYHQLHSLASHINEKSFENEDDIKKCLTDFIANKSLEIYQDGILSLPKRWQYVVNNDGSYYI